MRSALLRSGMGARPTFPPNAHRAREVGRAPLPVHARNQRIDRGPHALRPLRPPPCVPPCAGRAWVPDLHFHHAAVEGLSLFRPASFTREASSRGSQPPKPSVPCPIPPRPPRLRVRSSAAPRHFPPSRQILEVVLPLPPPCVQCSVFNADTGCQMPDTGWRASASGIRRSAFGISARSAFRIRSGYRRGYDASAAPSRIYSALRPVVAGSLLSNAFRPPRSALVRRRAARYGGQDAGQAANAECGTRKAELTWEPYNAA